MTLTMATHLVLLLLSLSALFLSKSSLSNAAFVSIDCGSSERYTDENSIQWTGDNAYILSGESHVVEDSFKPYVMTSLRAFSTRKKNCYSINVKEGERVLVRASFYYGNYDRQSSPPAFDLQFDGNYWATVNTTMYEVVAHEALYTVKGNTTNICVAQTMPNQLPFISALELRSLLPGMYRQVAPNYAMFLNQRIAFGANQTIRHPDDTYDRIWAPQHRVISNDVINLAPEIDITSAADLPPAAVLKNAIVATVTAQSIFMSAELPETEVPIYMATYFSEVSVLNPQKKRSFQVYINNSPAPKNPISPPFGGVTEVIITNTSAHSETEFSVTAAPDSTLPPLINAMELYTVSKALTDGTNKNDVQGLAMLQKAFDILQDWKGDPCLPSPFSWDWIECSSGATPRVIALNLTSYGLTGLLPDFSAMDVLQTIDLQSNSIEGPVPDFLATFPNLTSLNLANNKFSGPIPNSISKNNKLTLVGDCFNGNGPSCKAPPRHSSGQNQREDTSRSGSGVPNSGGNKKTNMLQLVLKATIQFFLLSLLLRSH